MTADEVDCAAEVMVAFWQRSRTLDLRTRQLCARAAAAVDPRGTLADAARTEPYPRTSALAAAIRAAAGDPEVAGLVRQLVRVAPTPPGERAAAPSLPTQRVNVSGNGNVGFAVGGDLHMGPAGLAGLAGPLGAVGAARTGSAADQVQAAAPADVVLVVAADPVDLERLRLGQEAREIREALRSSSRRSQWTVDTWSAVRLRDFSQALLEQRPRVVHFSGHGSARGALFFEDEVGAARRIPPEALVDLFAVVEGAVDCVVLNACYSESQARAISACVPFVIGSSTAVPDNAAIRFSVGFYQALGAGYRIPEAYRTGCAHFRGDENPGVPLPVLVERAS